MENEYFNCLSLTEKQDFLREHGEFMVTTDFYGASIHLYSLNSDFVEVYHHPVLRNVMRVSYATHQDLNKHLRSISLSI
jgi:hypothetical protein